MARLYELEDRVAVLRAQQADTAASPVDLHPSIAETYRKKVMRLTQALNHPAERDEAATALRGLIEKVVAPGFERRALPRGFHVWIRGVDFGQRKTRYPIGIAG